MLSSWLISFENEATNVDLIMDWLDCMALLRSGDLYPSQLGTSGLTLVAICSSRFLSCTRTCCTSESSLIKKFNYPIIRKLITLRCALEVWDQEKNRSRVSVNILFHGKFSLTAAGDLSRLIHQFAAAKSWCKEKQTTPAGLCWTQHHPAGVSIRNKT
jgi:hypothetical protein